MKTPINRTSLGMLMAISAVLAGCGGGGSGSASSPAAPVYTYVPPKLGAQMVYSDVLLDNQSNTINRTLVVNVSAVNPDGAYTASEVDPSHDRVFSGSVDHTFYPSIYSFDASGHATNWSVTPASGTPVDCQMSTPQSSGAPSPMTAGQTWTSTYTEVCGNGPGRTYTQTGTFAGIEPLTVAAGSFSAYKFTSVTSSTVDGATTTETATRWRNASLSDSRLLKSVVLVSHTGTPPPAGALVSDTQELQSFH